LPTSKLAVEAMHLTWPDGSQVESGGDHYPSDIYVVDVNGKHVRNLTHDAPTNRLVDRLPDGRIHPRATGSCSSVGAGST
jgi:hypothetical protein